MGCICPLHSDKASSSTPMVMQLSATLKVGQCQELDVDVEKIDHVAQAQAVDDVAQRPAQDEGVGE